MDMPRGKIKGICATIRASHLPRAAKERHFRQSHADFVEAYPRLFEACMDPRFPLDMLEYMLDKRDELKDDSVSLEDADKTVYGKLSERYVLPTLPPDVREAAAREMTEKI
jgi:hypothetical protein